MPDINQPTISTNGIVRPTLVEVDLTRLRENFAAIRRHVAPAKVMPILKANAYGHGLVPVAQWMESLGADYIGVAVLEEGILLREHGIQTPILVLGGILGNQVPGFLKYNLTITASSAEKLCQIEEAAEQMGVRARVHLKIDTGMERVGVHYYSAEGFLETALKCRHIDLEGIYSHFANADDLDLRHARLQLERFQEVLSFYEKRSLPPPPLRHMANSPAILQLPEATFDLVRPGLAVLRGLPKPGDHAHGDGAPGAELEIAGGVLQGDPAGAPGRLRLHLADGPHGAGGHRAGRLWRWLFSKYVGQGAGRCCAGKNTRWWGASRWTRWW